MAKQTKLNPFAATLGAAGRIAGVTPAALTTLLGYVQRGQGRPDGAAKHRLRRRIA